MNAQVSVHSENGYGMDKLCTGQMDWVICEKLGMRSTIWTRILSVYGRMTGHSLWSLRKFKDLEKGKMVRTGDIVWEAAMRRSFAPILRSFMITFENIDKNWKKVQNRKRVILQTTLINKEMFISTRMAAWSILIE